MREGRQITLALACLFGAMGASDIARAEILSADLRVDGMSCPFCAFGIEKKLQGIDGVTKVEVLLDEGRLQLRLAPGNTATVVALGTAVEKAGFELAGLALEVRGTLDIEPTEVWLEAHEGLRLLLFEREGDGERPLSPTRREKLTVDDHGQVVVSGQVLGAGDPPRLVVDLPQKAAGEGHR